MEDKKQPQIWGQQPLAVVIGAGGMGTAVARRLGQEHRVLLVDIDPQRLSEQEHRLRADGIQADRHLCDITSPDSVAQLATVVQQHGGFNTLAHVTGLSPAMADWRTIMSVNLIGPALVTEALGPHVKPGSSAILVASLAAHLQTPPQAITDVLDAPLAADFWLRLDALEAEFTPQLAYTWSKHALIRLAQRQAVAWGLRGGRVMSVSPGLIATPQGLNEFKQANSKPALLQACPLQRQGNVQEVAAVIAFLASAAASYISGTDILVDGGNLAGTGQWRKQF